MQGRAGSPSRRPWSAPLVSFENVVRKVLSRLTLATLVPPVVLLPQSTPSPKQPAAATGRHAVYQQLPFSVIKCAHHKCAMGHSEAGKRIGHVSVCFDGKLVVWGGYNDERLNRNFPTLELWVYDPLYQKWALWTCVEKRVPSDDMPPGTSGATSCLIGSDMYIFGGYTMTGNVNSIFRIDLSPLRSSETVTPRTVTIEKVRPANAEDAPIPSDKNVSWTHNGLFYVFGGYGYEPEQGDRFRRLMPRDSLFLPDPASQWQSSAHSRRGWNNQLACFDPVRERWSYPKVTGQWPVPRAAHAAAKLGSCVLIFGGRHDRHRVNDLWLLDMDSMAWREIKCQGTPEGRSWHSLTAISSDEVLLYGGLSNSRQPLSDCVVYSVSKNSWLPVSVRAEPRLWHSAVFSDRDQQVLIYGGGTSDILDHSMDSSEIYTSDLITMRFCPDSLTRLCLDACSAHTDKLLSHFEELPRSLSRVLFLRHEAGHELGS